MKPATVTRRCSPAVLAALSLLLVTLPGHAADASACQPAPLQGRDLYLRGSFNNWSTQDAHRLRWRCDHYEVVVRLDGMHSFKVADEDWSADADFGSPDGPANTPGQPVNLKPRGASINHRFGGHHKLEVRMPQDPAASATLVITHSQIAPEQQASDEPPVTDAQALSLRFDSRLAKHKAPFGAITPGTEVTFQLAGAPAASAVTLVVERRQLEGNQEVLAYHEVARVPMHWRAGSDGGAWQGRYRFDAVSIFGYTFEVQVNGQTYIYQNNANTVHWTREKGSSGLGRVELAKPNRKSIRRFRQTVHAADFAVPGWARDAVYYYIFPERFRNGNPANDPKPGITPYHDKTVELHPRWNEPPYKPGTGDGSDDLYNNDFFGGDLQGIIDKLDYIADLGANTLYLTPVFQAESNHKYDTSNYLQIDRAFGSNEDFSRLTAEAAKRGIRVIPDASLNHVGRDSLYFDRHGKYGGEGAFFGGKVNPASPWADWFKFDSTQTEPDKQYKGWVGVVDLPELNKASPSFRRFAYDAADSAMKRWLDRGAAGWRMDVAPWVPDDFWRGWRSAIKQHKSDALTIAETWFDASKFFLGDSFDSTMNYIFRNAVLAYANGADARVEYEHIEHIREAYPPQAFYALMNLVSSHDQARALHVFGYHGPNDAPATVALAKQRLRLAAFFQMVFPGAPAIYYGDEVGVTGGDDPYNRATYPWADQGGQPDTALLADFKRLTQLRQALPILRHGSLSAPLSINEHVIVLARQSGKDWAITATNNATTAQTVTVALPEGAPTGPWTDALAGSKVSIKEGKLTLVVPALFGSVLTADKAP